MESINYNTDLLATNSMYEHNKQIHETVNQISNANIVNNRNVQPVINQEFNITMPNVTNSTCAENLMKDLQSLSTKKLQFFNL